MRVRRRGATAHSAPLKQPWVPGWRTLGAVAGLILLSWAALTMIYRPRAAVEMHEGLPYALLRVPGATPGSWLSLYGETLPLDETGAVRIALAALELAPGDYTLPLRYHAADRSARALPLRIRIPWRLQHQIDLHPTDATPRVVLRAEVREETRLRLREQEVLLAPGRAYSFAWPVEIAGPSAALPGSAQRFDYALRSETRTDTGAYHVHLRPTPLSIDAPWRGFALPAAGRIYVAGATHPDARVHVQGIEVPNEGGRFFERVALRANSRAELEAVDLQVWAPGYLPVQRKLGVRRQAPPLALPELPYAALSLRNLGLHLRLRGRVMKARLGELGAELTLSLRPCEGQRACLAQAWFPAPLRPLEGREVQLGGMLTGVRDGVPELRITRLDAVEL